MPTKRASHAGHRGTGGGSSASPPHVVKARAFGSAAAHPTTGAAMSSHLSAPLFASSSSVGNNVPGGGVRGGNSVAPISAAAAHASSRLAAQLELQRRAETQGAQWAREIEAMRGGARHMHMISQAPPPAPLPPPAAAMQSAPQPPAVVASLLASTSGVHVSPVAAPVDRAPSPATLVVSPPLLHSLQEPSTPPSNGFSPTVVMHPMSPYLMHQPHSKVPLPPQPSETTAAAVAAVSSAVDAVPAISLAAPIAASAAAPSSWLDSAAVGDSERSAASVSSSEPGAISTLSLPAEVPVRIASPRTHRLAQRGHSRNPSSSGLSLSGRSRPTTSNGAVVAARPAAIVVAPGGPGGSLRPSSRALVAGLLASVKAVDAYADSLSPVLQPQSPHVAAASTPSSTATFPSVPAVPALDLMQLQQPQEAAVPERPQDDQPSATTVHAATTTAVPQADRSALATTAPVPVSAEPVVPVATATATAAHVAPTSSSSASAASTGGGTSTQARLMAQLVAEKITPGQQAVPKLTQQQPLGPEEQARREPEQLKQDCLAIVQVQPAEARTPEQRAQLIAWMQRQPSALLRELQPHVLAKLCDRVLYMQARAGSLIFKQGEQSDAMFIVVSGTVSIWINPPPAPAAKGNKSAAAASTDDTEVFHHAELEGPSGGGGGSGASGAGSDNSDEDEAAKDSDSSDDSDDGGSKRAGRTQQPDMSPTSGNHHNNKPRRRRKAAARKKAGGSSTSSPAFTPATPSHSASSPGGGGGGGSGNAVPAKYRRPVGLGISSSPLFIGTMSAGEERCTFGELGLVSGDARSATVKAESERTELLVVRKHDFDTVLRDYSDLLKRKVQLLASFPNFHSAAANVSSTDLKTSSGPSKGLISESYLRKLSLFLKEVKYTSRGSTVFAQGTRADFVYFLVEGEVEVLQRVEHVLPTVKGASGAASDATAAAPGSQTARAAPTKRTRMVEVVLARIRAELPAHLRREKMKTLLDHEAEEEAKEGAGINQKQPLSSAASTTSLHSGGASSTSLPSNGGGHVASSSSGQILGESPLFQKSLRGLHDVTVRTLAGSCTFFVMRREDFLRRINFILLSRFQARWREKQEFRARRLREIRLPAETLAADRGTGGGSAAQTISSARSATTVSSVFCAPSLRRKQLQLATHRNMRLLPTLTSQSQPTQTISAAATAPALQQHLQHATAAPSARTVHISREVTTGAGAQQRAEHAAALRDRQRERERTRALNQSIPLQSAQMVQQQQPDGSGHQSTRASRRASMALSLASAAAAAAAGVLGASSVAERFDSAFSAEPLSPLTSSSRMLVSAAAPVNPTLQLTRRGSTGLAPELRPNILLTAVQAQMSSPPQSKRASLNNVPAAISTGNDASASLMVAMPHSLPRSLPVSSISSSSSGDSLAPPHPSRSSGGVAVPSLTASHSSSSLGALLSTSSLADGANGSNSARGMRTNAKALGGGSLSARGASTSHTGVASSVSSSSHRSAIAAATSLSAEQHLVLSSQLRSTDAGTRARRIVALMQEMKERQEDWTVTTKEESSDNWAAAHARTLDASSTLSVSPSSRIVPSALAPDGSAAVGASGLVGDRATAADLALVTLPLTNEREMWQLREKKRDRLRMQRAAVAGVLAHGNGLPVTDEAVQTATAAAAAGATGGIGSNGWTHLNPLQKQSKHATASDAPLPTPAYEFPGRPPQRHAQTQLSHLPPTHQFAPCYSQSAHTFALGTRIQMHSHSARTRMAHEILPPSSTTQIQWPLLASTSRGAANPLAGLAGGDPALLGSTSPRSSLTTARHAPSGLFVPRVSGGATPAEVAAKAHAELLEFKEAMVSPGGKRRDSGELWTSQAMAALANHRQPLLPSSQPRVSASSSVTSLLSAASGPPGEGASAVPRLRRGDEHAAWLGALLRAPRRGGEDDLPDAEETTRTMLRRVEVSMEGVMPARKRQSFKNSSKRLRTSTNGHTAASADVALPSSTATPVIDSLPVVPTASAVLPGLVPTSVGPLSIDEELTLAARPAAKMLHQRGKANGNRARARYA